ncbi:MAG: lipid II flippase MurJ, partial [Minisyncoccia bacterium]
LTALAARLSEGSVSVFTLAGNLENVPLSLIGGSYAVAAFPALSKHAADNRPEFERVLSGSARHIILWSTVFIGLVVVLRAYIVRVILGSGAFDWSATRLTAALLALFVVGLAAQGLVLLFSRALYAAKQSWRPFAYQLGAAIFTALIAVFFLSSAAQPFAVWLAGFLRVGDLTDTLVLTLAFAATLGEVFLAAWSTIALKKVAPDLARSLLRPLAQGVAASVLAGAASYGVLWGLGGIAPLTTLGVVFFDGLIAGVIGLLVAGVALHLMKNEEFADIASAARRISAKVLPPSAPEESPHP